MRGKWLIKRVREKVTKVNDWKVERKFTQSVFCIDGEFCKITMTKSLKYSFCQNYGG
jgi:hypothetical protein